MDPRQPLGGGHRHLAAGPRTARERHHGHRRVADQSLARGGTAADHVEYARREDVDQQLRHPHRGGGCQLGGLQHDGVPGGDRRCPLPHCHHQRVVPGRDLPADAHRLAPDPRRHAHRDVLGRGQAGEQPASPGKEPDLVDDRRQLLLQHDCVRLAGISHLHPGQIIGMPLQDVRRREEGQAPISRDGVSPIGESLEGRRAGQIETFAAVRLGHVPTRAGRRVLDGPSLAAYGCDGAALNDVVENDGLSHKAALPCRESLHRLNSQSMTVSQHGESRSHWRLPPWRSSPRGSTGSSPTRRRRSLTPAQVSRSQRSGAPGLAGGVTSSWQITRPSRSG